MPSKKNDKSGIWICICFGGFFAVMLIAMAANAWVMMAGSPYTTVFDLIMFVGGPIGMLILFTVICITTYRNRSAVIAGPDLSEVPIPIVGMPEITLHPDEGEAIITLPAKCSNCGAALAMDEVDWVGPLQFKCPNCGATQFATKKKI